MTSMNTPTASDVEQFSPFRPKSTFFPPVNNSCLTAFTKKVTHDIERLFEGGNRTMKSNLTIGEKNAIQWLQDNDDLVIRTADKGGAVIVWGKAQYITEAMKQLNNPQYYTPLATNPLNQVRADLVAILDKGLHNEWITKKEYDFLLPNDPTLSVFYMLPKVHKNILEPPGRPIISGMGSITEPASKFIDFHIKPLTMALPAYIRDTTHVLSILDEIKNVNNAYLVTMDVEALYTNIDHEEGLEALRQALQKRPNDTPPTEFIVDLAKWTLNNNIFLFQDRLFRQKKGTAMGAAYAPNFAGLFMGLWEDQYIFGDVNPFKHCIRWYGRFIDDLCFIFSGPLEQLKEFHQYLNCSNPNIKLSLEYSQSEIHFLDLNITVDEQGYLHTSIFRKVTDRNTILHADSFHPNSLITNIPYGQFQRIRRICDSEIDFDVGVKADDMYSRFQHRGYQKKDTALGKAKALNRKELVKKPTAKENLKKMFFTAQYTHCHTRSKDYQQKLGHS